MNNKILVEFSLTQAKEAWKVRSEVRRGRRGRFDRKRRVWKFTPTIGDMIYKGDIFEWMVSNEELRDILAALKCISINIYRRIKEEVYSVNEFNISLEKELGFGIKIEASLEPKQRKPSELTPYLFVLFPMDKPTEVCYIVNKRDELVRDPIGYKIMAGDRLIWVPNERDLEEITVSLARLDEDHKKRIIQEIFQVLDRDMPG